MAAGAGEPLLLAVRVEGGVFGESFAFTPEGERQRRAIAASCA
ncbi:hypothetical protein [Streptomyces spectabilis]|nr:hypothetical protein [Streptomyces spectabilis]